MSSDDIDFPGGAFDPSLPDGRAGARLHLLADRVRAVCNGGATIELRYERMRLELGGASGRMVFLRGPEADPVLHCEERGFLEALRRESGGRLDEAVTALVGNERGRRHSSLTWWLVGLAALVLLGWGAWIGLGWAFQRAIEKTPVTVDRKIGDMAESGQDLGHDLPAPLPLQAVQEMVDRLKPHAGIEGIEWRPRVIEDGDLNAFALPGGRMVVLSGLIIKAERPDQVAGVVAHEMAHVARRHGLKHVARSLGVVAVAQLLLGDASGLAGLAAQGATLAVLTGYSRDQEREADAEGARMMAAAGLDPRGLIEFFALMKATPGSEAPGALRWMSTHPQHDERIAELERLIPTLQRGPAKPLACDWTAVRAAAGFKPAEAPAKPAP